MRDLVLAATCDFQASYPLLRSWPVSFTSPVPGGVIKSGWGDPRPYRNGTHYGVDLYSTDRSVVAAASGTIDRIDRVDNSTAGRHVIIKTQAAGLVIYHRYLHMATIARVLKRGQFVEQGTQLGTYGRTGFSASGAKAHLHFDLFGNATAVQHYLAQYGQPSPPLPPKRHWGVALPSEPFIPAKYTQTVIDRGAQRNVAMWTPGVAAPTAARATGALLVGAMVIAGLGTAAYVLWKD